MIVSCSQLKSGCFRCYLKSLECTWILLFFFGGGTLQRVSIVMVRSDPLKDILLSMVIGLSSRVLAFPTVAIRTE